MIWQQRAETSADEPDFAAMLQDVQWETHDREETWLISYADIISTFLAMVVLLFGRAALTAAPDADDDFAPPPVIATLPVPPAAETPVPTPAPAQPSVPTPTPTREERFVALVDARFGGRIAAERRSEGVVLTIPEVALFESARAALEPNAHALLAELAVTLRELGDARLAVEGHTDDRPVIGGSFASNWDLAAARANAVTRELLAHGLDARRVHSVSYADTRPVADNATPEGRAANRRVELKLELIGS